MGRYLRAETSPKAACPTCGEAVIGLRWCHEARCAEWHAERRRRSIIASLALLFAVFLAFVAFPAYAQASDTVQLADSFNTKALATTAVVELAAIVFLGRALLASYEARIADMQKAHTATLSVQVAASELAKEALESIAIVEHVVSKRS